MARRREFEYMLRRHEARRLDYMRYVEYELNLESLRALRTKRIEGGAVGSNHRSKKKNKKGKAAAADFCCVRLVRWIFDRAVMKFPGDVDIWLHYIEFSSRQGQSKVRTAARAVLGRRTDWPGEAGTGRFSASCHGGGLREVVWVVLLCHSKFREKRIRDHSRFCAASALAKRKKDEFAKASPGFFGVNRAGRLC